jgi:hypothetical protein
VKFIRLTRGKYAIVDDEDYHWLSQFKWHAVPGARTWYAARNGVPDENGKRLQICMHQLLYFNGEEVDHADGNGLDNRKSNLRFATKNQNQWNKRKACGHSSSSFKGVTWFKSAKRWIARMSHKGKVIRLGCFKKEKDAALAYNTEARKRFKEYARVNVIA